MTQPQQAATTAKCTVGSRQPSAYAMNGATTKTDNTRESEAYRQRPQTSFWMLSFLNDLRRMTAYA